MSTNDERRQPADPPAQQVIVVAHIRVTGQPDLVARFGDPFVSPDAAAILRALGWTEPTP